MTERLIASTTSQIRNIGAAVCDDGDARTRTVGDLVESSDNEDLYK